MAFRTRRIRLRVENAKCSFWLLVFQNEAALHAYAGRKLEMPTPWYCGGGCEMANRKTREICVCLCCDQLNHFIIGHECFHAALWYSRLNRREFTLDKWVAIRDEWNDYGSKEEVLADVCGSLLCEIWLQLRKRWRISCVPS